jgi:hypothetical protein
VGRACSTHWEGRNAYGVLVENPEGRRSLRIPTHRWDNNIKNDLTEVSGVVWTGLIWLRIGTSGGPLRTR